MPQHGNTPEKRPSMQELLDAGAAARAVCTPPHDAAPQTGAKKPPVVVAQREAA